MIRILIPAAGRGRRFTEAGYDLPKPLIDVRGKPMLSRIIDNVRPSRPHRYVILMQREHAERGEIVGFYDSHLILVDGVTDGAARTALLAKEHIDNDDPLMIVNSDQLLDWDVDAFLHRASPYDGRIVTFTAHDPKWSYVRREGDATWRGPHVAEGAEKRVVSDEATCGIYYWRKGSDFVRCAERMIERERRTSGEFYIAPVYNELIAEGGRVTTYRIAPEAMHGLGTPEDLAAYLASLAVPV